MRTLAIALVGIIAACSPPAPPAETETSSITASAEQTDPLAIALTPVVAEEIGQPVYLNVTTSTMDGDWGWIIAQPRTPAGEPIDWSQTTQASRAEHGVMDESGTIYALLKRENDQWRVVEHTIAPTDVAWMDWPARHGVPAALLGLPDTAQ